jgi:hypothetical protein
MTQTQRAQATRTRQTPKVMLVSELFEQPGDGGGEILKKRKHFGASKGSRNLE